MRSSARDYFLQGLHRQADLERKANVRSVFTRARHIEANVDMLQLRKVGSQALADSTTGQFVFTFDSSQFDGDDTLA